ncbi:hypothetical protein [Candidatus Solirubrobacter pratensis]|uniref:hypothetical protein n=1 Tax=Candidatus Solirubrobacter pratensis TaxID=1298857 RepID=UPI000480F9A1|nr:hypothetical protein [Candidatus Solirubrobacter pratensis]
MGPERSERLLNLIIDRLVWLEHDGYAPVGRDPQGMRIRLDYSSGRGRVAVSVDGGRGDIDIWLAPPKQNNPGAPIDFLRGPRVMMDSMLTTHGLRCPPDHWSRSADAEAVVGHYVGALQQLRDRELAGDWSLFRVAVEVARSGRDAAFKYWISRAVIDDPALAERLERLRPIGPSR